MFAFTAVSLALSLATLSNGQGVGTSTPEKHPALSVSECSGNGGCTAKGASVVIDSNWRWIHDKDSTNCYTGNKWNKTICANSKECTSKCLLDGADYGKTYGITTQKDEISLKFVQGDNVGSRVYLMESEDKYQMFKLKNQEFSFDVDLSTLPCGTNGALYLVSMDQDGGMAKNPTNKAGAKYGTGYCDAQCPRDIKWIDGKANSDNWKPSKYNKNSGTGQHGSCCAEMDIWEANSMGSAFTPHVCRNAGQKSCSGAECGSSEDRYGSMCDKDGCDFNSYRLGDQSFFGAGKKVDTKKPFTVITQFVTTDNTTSGDLAEIRRIYVQGGKTVQNSKTKIPGMTAWDSVSDDFCKEQKSTFGDPNTFGKMGGMKAMGKSLDEGMVLTLSIWDDYAAHMRWLDSTWPKTQGYKKPGVARGECKPGEGFPKNVEKSATDAKVTWSNIKYGPIGSTTKKYQ